MSASPDTWVMGTLGDENTFAGQAATRFAARLSGLGPPVYFASLDAVTDASLRGLIDFAVVTGETTAGATSDAMRRMLRGERLHVVTELVVPYDCLLLGKPGTRLTEISRVTGHGSISQCTDFLQQTLPHAVVQRHALNSAAAADDVIQGDGSTAVVGSQRLAESMGLTVLATDIDGGASAAWWLLSATPVTAPAPDRIVVRTGSSAGLTAVVRTLAQLGFEVRSVFNQPLGRLFGYRFVAIFTGPPCPEVVAAVESLPMQDVDLLGAFRSEADLPVRSRAIRLTTPNRDQRPNDGAEGPS
ncbi:prephenate dehydratase domain-containing protein [Nocardioides sp. LHG3406-4]|uniref:prephenate dehydratase domain-containing protein n=1 Tax=Nocardioides sp. LHG3406-4 TaxID=2804575 RepID=UPI003CEDC93E